MKEIMDYYQNKYLVVVAKKYGGIIKEKIKSEEGFKEKFDVNLDKILNNDK